MGEDAIRVIDIKDIPASGEFSEEEQTKIEENLYAVTDAIYKMNQCIKESKRAILEAEKIIGMAVPRTSDDTKFQISKYRYEPLQKRFRKLVEESPHTIQEIADYIGVSKSTICAWMYRNYGMSTWSLVAVADYFGVSLDYLTGRTEEPSINSEDMKKRMRESYEIYLKRICEKKYIDNPPVYRAPWPYNLLDELFQPYEKVPPEDIEERVYKALETLTPREAHVILSYYKDDGTLEEVGKKFRVTKERIRQIIIKAIRKLRCPSRSMLIEYSDEELALKREIASEKIKLEETLAELKEKVQKLQDAGSDIPVPENVKDELSNIKWYDEDMMLEELDLSVRAFNCLKRANINTISDFEMLIRAQGKSGVKHIRNLGQSTMYEIFWKMKNVTGKDWERIADEVDKELKEKETGC